MFFVPARWRVADINSTRKTNACRVLPFFSLRYTRDSKSTTIAKGNLVYMCSRWSLKAASRYTRGLPTQNIRQSMWTRTPPMYVCDTRALCGGDPLARGARHRHRFPRRPVAGSGTQNRRLSSIKLTTSGLFAVGSRLCVGEGACGQLARNSPFPPCICEWLIIRLSLLFYRNTIIDGTLIREDVGCSPPIIYSRIFNREEEE